MCYCVDEYVDTYGSWVEGELNKIKRGKKESDDSYNAKRKRKLDEILAIGDKKEEKKYAQPTPTKR